MTFSFDKIILSICESTTSWNLKKLDYFLPTIELAFHEMQIFYTRHSNNSKTIIVKAENLLGLFFNYSQNEDEEPRVFIQGFINNLNKRIEQSLKTFIEKKNFLMSLRVNDSQNDFKLQSDFFLNDSQINKSSYETSEKLGVNVQISSEGSKKIDINLQNLDFLLNLNLFFRLINFVSLDNFIVLVTPKGIFTPNNVFN